MKTIKKIFIFFTICLYPFISKAQGETTDRVDLGNGMYLIDDMLLEMKLTASQWEQLLTGSLTPFSTLIYNKFKDDFDFIIFVKNVPSDPLINYNWCVNISNNIQGIGMDIFDNTHDWGSSGKLKSIIWLDFRSAVATSIALHEITHNWGQQICLTYTLDNEPGYGHWLGMNNAGGMLGGFKSVRKVAENCDGIQGKTLYQITDFGDSQHYSDIELYIMGLKSAQDLRNTNFHLDIYSGISIDSSGVYPYNYLSTGSYFYSTKETSYTIDDLIAMHGPRIPDATVSQKQFKILTVALTPDTTKEDYDENIIHDLKYLAGLEDDKNYDLWYNSFTKATNNLGALVVDNLKGSLKLTNSIVNEVKQSDINIWHQNDALIVESPEIIMSITVYDLTGQIRKRWNGKSNQVKFIGLSDKNIFVVLVKLENGMIINRKIVL